MPYSATSELPPAVKDNLPKKAQEIFMGAFNSSHNAGKSEEVSFKIAWSAVERKYRKIGGKWVKKHFVNIRNNPIDPDRLFGTEEMLNELINKT